MSDNKKEDIAQSGNGGTEKDVENIELDEKAKDEKDQLLNDGEKEETPESPKGKDRESPISKAFFFSKYITFW